MFNDKMEINLYAMLLGHGLSEGSDVMDQECDEYVEGNNNDTVTGALREQEGWE